MSSERVVGWKPLGKYVLVELHRQPSALDLSVSRGVRYKTTADVLAVGPDIAGLEAGDVVLLNGEQGAIGSRELGEHLALIPLPLILARREGAGEES
jgi:hypothetical protein